MERMLLLFSFLIFNTSFGHQELQGNLNVWDISVPDLKKDRKYFIENEYEIIAVNYPKSLIQVVPKAANFADFARNDFFITSEHPLIENNLDPEYLDVNETKAVVAELARDYPDLAKLHVVGKTTDGLEIQALEITNFKKTHSKARVVFNGAHHAREVMSVEVPVDIMRSLLSNYGKDAKITNYLDNLDIFVIPQYNMDGRNNVFAGIDLMWRKNNWRDPTKRLYGVDLNRNYNFNFNKCGGSSGSVSSQTYRGPTAASEPETKSVQSFYLNIRPLASISYHSYSELVIFPNGCTGEKPEIIDRPIIESLGKEMGAKIIRDDGNPGYTVGYGWDILYSTDGTDIDFLYGAIGSVSYVIELNANNFQPSYSKWRNVTVERARPAWKHMLETSLKGPGVHLNIISGDKPSDIKVEVLEQKFQYGEWARRPDEKYQYYKFLNPGQYNIKVSSLHNSKTVQVNVTNAWENIDIDIQ